MEDAQGSFAPYPYRALRTERIGRFEVEEGELATTVGPRPYTIVYMRPYVCVLPVVGATTTDACAMFVRQYRYAVGAWQLELPAGGIEEGETPEAAAARELLEETGLIADELVPLGSVFPSGGSTTERAWLFCARCSKRTASSPDASEQTETVPVTRTELERLLGDCESGYEHAVTFALWVRMCAAGYADSWLPRV